MDFRLRWASRWRASLFALFVVVLSLFICSCTRQPSEYQPLDDPRRVERAVLTPAGGRIVLNGVTIEASAGALSSDTQFTVTGATRPEPLVRGLIPASQAIEISAPTDNFRLPVDITVTYDPELGDSSRLSVVHFNSDRRVWEPVRLLTVDTSAHTFTFETRDFSVFQQVSFEGIPKAARVDFDPKRNGWAIANPANCVVGAGACMGMSSYGVWFAVAHPDEDLATRYADPVRAEMLVTRAQIAAEPLSELLLKGTRKLLTSDTTTIREMMLDIAILRQPITLNLFGAPGNHAGIVFGYDESNFYFYDPNFPGETKSLPFSIDARGEAKFGVYADAQDRFRYEGFSHSPLPSLGRSRDWQRLYDDDAADYRGSALTITSHRNGQKAATGSITISGTVSSFDIENVIVWLDGKRQSASASNRSFTSTFSIGTGKHEIYVLAASSYAVRAGVSAGAHLTLYGDENAPEKDGGAGSETWSGIWFTDENPPPLEQTRAWQKDGTLPSVYAGTVEISFTRQPATTRTNVLRYELVGTITVTGLPIARGLSAGGSISHNGWLDFGHVVNGDPTVVTIGGGIRDDEDRFSTSLGYFYPQAGGTRFGRGTVYLNRR